VTERRDLEASLAEMDRKLRELQRELSLVAGQGGGASAELPVTGMPRAAGPPERPPPEPPPPEPTAPEAPAPPAPDPVARVVDEAAARVTELGRRIDDLAALRDELDSATQSLRSEYRAARPGAAAPREVVVDAGPFPDIATLSSFETALGEVDGVVDAAVRSFEGNRAIVDVHVRADAELAGALRGGLPFEVDVVQAQGGGLTLHLRSGA
jgi:hypothetical protein